MFRAAVFLLCLASVVIADVYVDVRKNQSDCESICAKDFSQHTDTKPEHLKACERGCRLFSLVQISKTDEDGKIAPGKTDSDKNGCEKACGEAYPAAGVKQTAEDTLKSHCTVGCKHGEQVHTGKQAAIQDELRFRDPIFGDIMGQMEAGGILNSRPFQMMHEMMNNMMEEMNRAMASVPWRVVITRTEGSSTEKKEESVPVTKSRVTVGQPGILVIRTSHSGILPVLDGSVSDMEDPFDEIRGSNTRFMDDDPFPRIKTATAVRTEQVPDGSDWLECVSRKAGVPRWLLLTSMFLCSLMFVWLCFAATGPAHEQRVYAISNSPPAYSLKQPWSDIPYICPDVERAVMESIEKSGDKELLIIDAKEKEEQAEALPAKVHMEFKA